MAFPEHCEGLVVFIIKPVSCDCESRLRSFPNEQDAILCTYGIRNSYFMDDNIVTVSLPPITQRIISGA